MTTSTSSPAPGSGSREPRHRAEGRGDTAGTAAGPVGVPAPRRTGGRHRAPDAPPSSGFTIVPGPRDGGPGEGTRPEAGPASGFRPLPPPPPGAPASRPTSSVGVPLGAVPTQRGADARDAAVPRRRPAPAPPEVLDDEAVTVPVRREALDRAAGRSVAEDPGPRDHAPDDGPVHAPALRPLTAHRPASPSPRARPRRGATRPDQTRSDGAHADRARSGRPPHGAPSRPAVARPVGPSGRVAPWETPPDRASTRAGLVAVAVGALGALLGLAPWSGLLPRVLPASALGATPVFNLAGALLGVVALGLGAVAMFRATGTTRGLLVGVIGACVGAAAIVVGLVV
ncbi:hypothetical protein [Actinomycetospora sp. TBRC 11914]|uniref:hypothetical protein n=1 Tax=Actinomycetospora sp. TBRC 11914 TaxID=2729387 RepID=UPI00145ED909|nr:hypothetical protein [Actinomycetospora sp. TBRC 11914]NMO92007.1 hypothetical protein [Actinomycetospora sp. TBRC 11914]